MVKNHFLLKNEQLKRLKIARGGKKIKKTQEKRKISPTKKRQTLKQTKLKLQPLIKRINSSTKPDKKIKKPPSCSSCEISHPDNFICPSKYSSIPSIPTLYPNEREFSNPLAYITKLRKQGYEKFGAVKVVPPSSWNPKFCFNTEKLITTRTQILQEMSKGEVSLLFSYFEI